jgi:cytochrome c556
MARKNSIISASLNDVGAIVFAVVGEGEFTIDPINDLTDAVSKRAVIHGLVQKVCDAAAMSKGATPSDKFAAMQAVAERLKGPDGEWSKRSGEGSGPVQGLIYRAFREFVETTAKAKKAKCPDEAAIRAVYDGKDRAGQLALRTVPAIAEIIERMKAEKGSTASPVEVENLLGELGL